MATDRKRPKELVGEHHTLPGEVVANILTTALEHVETSVKNTSPWWLREDNASVQDIRTGNALLARASLVCKRWRHVVSHMWRSIYLADIDDAALLWQSIAENGTTYKCKCLWIGPDLVEPVSQKDQHPLFKPTAGYVLSIVQHLVGSNHLRALSVPFEFLHLMSNARKQEAWQAVCTRVPELHLHALSGEMPRLYIHRPTYLHHSTSRVRSLALTNVIISEDPSTEQHDVIPFKIEEIVWQVPRWDHCCINYVPMFPKLKHLILSGWPDMGICIPLARVDLPLRQIGDPKNVSPVMDEEYRSMVVEPRIFLTPSLTSLELQCVASDRECKYTAGSKSAIFSLPGHRMLHLRSLVIRLPECSRCLQHVIGICAAFGDPTFMPELQFLPSITVDGIWSQNGSVRQVLSANIERLRQGLEGLRDRNIIINIEELEDTVWKFAL